MIIDFDSIDATTRYKIMSHTITPRPIAWIVTEDEGVVNMAPFSYFVPLSSEPPTLIVSIGHKPDLTPKDTLFNIRKTQKATVCLVQESHMESMHATSESLPKEISEAKKHDISHSRLQEGFPPVVDGCQCALFCSLHQEVDLKGSKTIPLILEIHHYHVEDSICEDGYRITLQNVGRTGRSYLLGGEIKTLS